MAPRETVSVPQRGEVYLVNFDPTVGAEIRKTRPALILQNDIANRFSPITIVAAITSQVEERLYPTEVLVRPPEAGPGNDGPVLFNQIPPITRRLLLRP